MDQHNLVLVYATIDTTDNAEKLATVLLQKKLVACVNVIPGVKSMYWWQGAIASDSEVIMICKTTVALYQELENAIKAHHPYQLPCIVKIAATAHAPFAQFVHDATQ